MRWGWWIYPRQAVSVSRVLPDRQGMQIDPTLLFAGGMAGFFMSRIGSLKGWVERRLTFSVTLIYEAHYAVASKLAAELKDRSLLLGDCNHGYEVPPGGAVREQAREPARLAPGTRWARIDGRRVLVSTTREKNQAGAGYTEESSLTVLGRHSDWLMEWVSEAVREYKSDLKSGLPVYAWGGYGWQRSTLRPFRPIDTIDHPDEAPRKLLESIHVWQSGRDLVWRRGENFHAGFLLYGPPGSGKTSTAIAVASELRRPLYVLAPSALKDGHPENAMREVPSGSVLLFEEVDQVFGKSKKPEAAQMLASMLSELDGPLSKQDVVRLYTTNHPELLDERFMRAGRVDASFEFPARSAHPLSSY